MTEETVLTLPTAREVLAEAWDEARRGNGEAAMVAALTELARELREGSRGVMPAVVVSDNVPEEVTQMIAQAASERDVWRRKAEATREREAAALAELADLRSKLGDVRDELNDAREANRRLDNAFIVERDNREGWQQRAAWAEEQLNLAARCGSCSTCAHRMVNAEQSDSPEPVSAPLFSSLADEIRATALTSASIVVPQLVYGGPEVAEQHQAEAGYAKGGLVEDTKVLTIQPPDAVVPAGWTPGGATPPRSPLMDKAVEETACVQPGCGKGIYEAVVGTSSEGPIRKWKHRGSGKAECEQTFDGVTTHAMPA